MINEEKLEGHGETFQVEHIVQEKFLGLAGVPQLVGHHPAEQNVTGSSLCQGT